MQTNFIETETRKRGELAPARLGEKLRRIREDYDLTQGKMLLIINPTEFSEVNRARVSQYENGTRVPSLVELYNYARFAGVTMETLVNDELDLPANTRQSKSDFSNYEELLMGREAKNSEINNGDDSFNAEDVLPVENTSGPDGNSSFKTRTIEPLQMESDTSHTNCSSPSGAIYSIRLSEEISDDGKTVFLNLLKELPFIKMGRISPEKFLEQSIAAGLDDYHARHAESALARRMQLLFEDETVD